MKIVAVWRLFLVLQVAGLSGTSRPSSNARRLSQVSIPHCDAALPDLWEQSAVVVPRSPEATDGQDLCGKIFVTCYMASEPQLHWPSQTSKGHLDNKG